MLIDITDASVDTSRLSLRVYRLYHHRGHEGGDVSLTM